MIPFQPALRCLVIGLFFQWNVCAQDMMRVRHTIDTLCSPAFHGRSAAFSGDSLAAGFIGEIFRKNNLAPMGNQYNQYFEYDINIFPGDVELHLGKKKLKPGKDFILHPSSGGGTGKYRTLKMDSAVFYNPTQLDEFFSRDLSKYVIVFQSKDEKLLKNIPDKYSFKMNRVGALVEIFPAKLTASVSPHQYETPYFQVKAGIWKDFSGKIYFKIDAQIEKKHRSKNVIGFLKGREDTDTCVIISAHYDHLGTLGKTVYFPGANDNASGVSMLLELAAYYSDAMHQSRYNMIFIAFGAEEIGLLGSKYYTENPLLPLSKIKFLLNLDLMGTGEDGMMVVNGVVFEKEFKIMEEINSENAYLPAIKKRGKAANSDHYYFTEKGVPSFFFYTLGGISAYHDIDDKPETLPLTKYRQVFSLIRDFINRL